ncbi:MAG: methyl-accepting chemotaxis protein [Methylomicrobium sp.]
MFNKFTIKKSLILIVACSAALAMFMGALGLVGIQKTNAGLRSVYLDRVVPASQLSEIQRRQLANIRAITKASFIDGNTSDTIASINENIKQISRIWDVYMTTYLTSEEAKFARQFAADRKRFVAEGLKPALEILKTGDKVALQTHIKEVVERLYVPCEKGIQSLIQLQLDVARQEYESAQNRFRILLTVSIAVCILGLALLVFIANTLIRSISRSLQTAQQAAAAIAAGNLDSSFDTSQQNEIGALLRSMKTMQDSINFFFAELNSMAQKHAQGWVKERLDAAKFAGTYSRMADEINELIQSHIAINRQLLGIVTQYAKGDFSMDMAVLPGETRVITETMNSAKQTFLEVNNEISMLVEAGAKGDFSKRSDASRFEFMFRDILNNLNSLMETCDVGFNDVLRVADALSKGDLTQTITRDYPGALGAMKTGINSTIETINFFVAELNSMAQKHAQGWVKERLDAAKFAGTYSRMADEINELIQSRIAINRRLLGIVTQYAKGDFSMDMDVLPGETRVITETMNSAKQTFLEVNNEISMLVEAGAKGDFSKRSDADRFEFMFRDILNNLNSLMETCDVGFNDVLRVADALAQGDLTQAISRDYPGALGAMKTGINSTVENLKEMVSAIQESAYAINGASKEITAGNNDLSHRTEEQAASLEQTAASMEELASTVNANTESAKQANHLAQGASDVASKGVEVVGQVVKTMDSISESARKITEIIAVIDSIAFQTNILSLNAAVEAARAGEHGRGFAVVADEVRKLAQRAAAEAGEIKGLIGDSETKVAEGGKLVAHAGKTMEDIVEAIQKVTTIVSHISEASIEQNGGLNQINQAISQMDLVTQQNAALVEQAAAAAEAMQEQTETLTQMAGRFNVGNESRSRSATKVYSMPKSESVKIYPKEHRQSYKKSMSAKSELKLINNTEWDEF